MADTIWGSTSKPVSARKLAAVIESIPDLDGTLYIGYPILGTPSGAFPFDAVLLSPQTGALIFDIVEGKDIGDFKERQDEFYTKLQSKLIQYPNLVKGRTLLVPINTATFAPALKTSEHEADDQHPILGIQDLQEFVSGVEWENSKVFPELASALQSLSNIRKGRKRRDVVNEKSRGATVRRLEESIANLDYDQSAAVIETVEGIQRIRGLAGSGKTIVLALKVAYLHAQNPDWKIAVTFNTRSLKGQFERLINTFVIEQTNDEPDWDKIEIINAWGAPGGAQRSGLYYKFCQLNGITYYDYGSAVAKFGNASPFEAACNEAIAAVQAPRQVYDAILVDEAQDLSPAFLRLCYASLKQPKRLVYAYDELQSLTDTSLPSPGEIFGPEATFAESKPGEPKQDIMLARCYRNSRPILTSAHALGFGIYREPGGLIQFFDQHQLWLDVGYRVHDGALEDGKAVSLERTSETSPKFLESHSPIDDLIQFKKFDSLEAQDKWLVSQIEKNIREEELFGDDIVVINPDPLKTRDAVSAARAKLFSKKINSSLAGVSTSPDIFTEPDVVTFTGVFRAKGNEAAMVYIINADDCFSWPSAYYLARARNQLFTAMTRSKAWVRVLGVGSKMDGLIAEFERIKAHHFRLDFVYPTEEQRKTLRKIGQEAPLKGKRRKRSERTIASLLDLLEAEELKIEDLEPALQKRLRTALRDRK